MAVLVLKSCYLVDHPGRRYASHTGNAVCCLSTNVYVYVHVHIMHLFNSCPHTHQFSVPSRMQQAVVASSRYKKPVEKPFIIQYVKLVLCLCNPFITLQGYIATPKFSPVNRGYGFTIILGKIQPHNEHKISILNAP